MSRQPAERRARLRRGWLGEQAAAAVLILKGYRILARRERTPLGEIDLIARRGRRIAFIEVKRRARWEDGEAAITPRQAERVRRAAGYWLSRRRSLQEHEIGLDAIIVVPLRWPRHHENALSGS